MVGTQGSRMKNTQISILCMDSAMAMPEQQWRNTGSSYISFIYKDPAAGIPNLF
jgi:hypothetical protein